ncbi:MAG: diguanylate cyclase [Anaerolineales bacterium]|nr:diguanylate cyclase [Anaerolineales bacterium]
MNLHLFVFLLFLTATITLAFALRAWPRGASRTYYFSFLLGSLSLGTLSYAMELWGTDETSKFVWLLIKYVGFELSALFWLLFTSQFTGKQPPPRLLVKFLKIIPVLTSLITGTTHQTGWMFLNLQLREQIFLVYTYGPYFWFHTVYVYLLFAAGFIRVMQWYRQKHPRKLVQQGGLVFGIGLPLFTNLFVLFCLPKIFGLDLTPLSLSLGVLIICWILFGPDLSGVNPIAREALIESLKDGVIVMDTSRMITDANPAAYHLLTVSPPLHGRFLDAVLPVSITLPSLDLTDTYPHQEITLTTSEEEARVLDLRASPLFDQARLLRGWLLLLRDITEQKRLQNELKKQSMRNAALAEIELAINQPHELAGVLKKIVDTTYELLPAPGGATILTWNEATRTFEHADSTLSADRLNTLLIRAKQGRGSAPWIIAEKRPRIVPDTRSEPFNEHEVMGNNQILAYVGLPLTVNEKVVGVLYANDKQPHRYTEEDLHFLQTLANRAANAIFRVQQFTEVQQQAITDHLTGILNRRQLFNLGELEFRRARRFDRPLSAIMLDIDHFKKINDTYGHAQGDEVLIALAQFLKIQLREFDILGRYGGEEFVIILPGADLNNARNVAYRLRKGVQDRPLVHGITSITVSLGVAELTPAIPNFQALVNKADLAMYEAKRAGRDQVAWLE